MKKFEPHYRLVRYGAAAKIEKASRQQRMHSLRFSRGSHCLEYGVLMMSAYRQATQKPSQNCPGYREDERSGKEGQEVEDWSLVVFVS